MARLAFVLALAVNFALVSAYRRKAQAGRRFSLRQEGVWIAIPLRAVALAMLAYMLAYIVSPATVAWSLVAVPAWAQGLGAGTALLAVPPLLHWAQKSLGANVTTTVITRETHHLVTRGPYRFVRNPLYTIGVLLYGSLAITIGSWLLALAAGAAFTIAVVRLPKEESALLERFGDEYRDYQRNTPRFVPRLSRPA